MIFLRVGLFFMVGTIYAITVQPSGSFGKDQQVEIEDSWDEFWNSASSHER
jgi:hypothetical protein